MTGREHDCFGNPLPMFHEWFDPAWIRTLAANLAIGAALCRAFRLGYDRCATHGDAWRPGCQRSAP